MTLDVAEKQLKHNEWIKTCLSVTAAFGKEFLRVDSGPALNWILNAQQHRVGRTIISAIHKDKLDCGSNRPISVIIDEFSLLWPDESSPNHQTGFIRQTQYKNVTCYRSHTKEQLEDTRISIDALKHSIQFSLSLNKFKADGHSSDRFTLERESRNCCFT